MKFYTNCSVASLEYPSNTKEVNADRLSSNSHFRVEKFDSTDAVLDEQLRPNRSLALVDTSPPVGNLWCDDHTCVEVDTGSKQIWHYGKPWPRSSGQLPSTKKSLLRGRLPLRP
ncbi:unnamed protein product [Phytophthora lilii]|uniref:Unnamed protein product n=1 Tax=Phytophthora lilii TaxID=2077276 RepID=A0A9W6TC08_9STRA|nr:unnamed protein product [Phytophthora lilii]